MKIYIQRFAHLLIEFRRKMRFNRSRINIFILIFCLLCLCFILRLYYFHAPFQCSKPIPTLIWLSFSSLFTDSCRYKCIFYLHFCDIILLENTTRITCWDTFNNKSYIKYFKRQLSNINYAINNRSRLIYIKST